MSCSRMARRARDMAVPTVATTTKAATCFDICAASASACTSAVPVAVREHMPQIDARTALRLAKRGRIGERTVRRALARPLDAMQQRVVDAIDARRPQAMRWLQPSGEGVRVTLEPRVSVYSLRPTQSEANSCIVEGVLARAASAPAITEANPLVVSSDGYVIDGHHRYHALMRLSRRRRRIAHATIVRLHAPHAVCMRLAWLLGRGQRHTLSL